ncbi:MAG TPA: hypothetical protein VF450_17695 [Noviherbaspirillum sp.]
MKAAATSALAAALLLPLLATAQTMKAPSDPGMAKPPADAGAVVKPPPVNDKSVATPPKNVDPEIDAATRDIDRATKKKSENRKKHGTARKSGAREKAPGESSRDMPGEVPRETPAAKP